MTANIFNYRNSRCRKFFREFSTYTGKFFTNKIKNSHLQIVREWDNGYEFYETLNPIDKEKYWKEDEFCKYNFKTEKNELLKLRKCKYIFF